MNLLYKCEKTLRYTILSIIYLLQDDITQNLFFTQPPPPWRAQRVADVEAARDRKSAKAGRHGLRTPSLRPPLSANIRESHGYPYWNYNCGNHILCMTHVRPCETVA